MQDVLSSYGRQPSSLSPSVTHVGCCTVTAVAQLTGVCIVPHPKVAREARLVFWDWSCYNTHEEYGIRAWLAETPMTNMEFGHGWLKHPCIIWNSGMVG